MFKQVDEAILALQAIAVAIVFLGCVIALVGTALTIALLRRNQDRVRTSKESSCSQDGRDTGR